MVTEEFIFNQYKPWFRSLLAVLGSIFLAGCNDVATYVGDNGTTFSYKWWVLLLWIFASGAVALFGIAVRKNPDRKGLPLAIAAVVFALVIVPAIYSDRVTVSDHGFEANRGLWGQAPSLDVEFSNLNSIRVTYEAHIMSGTSTGTDRHYVLYFNGKYGSNGRFELANDVFWAAGDRIVRVAKHKGIKIIRERRVRYHLF